MMNGTKQIIRKELNRVFSDKKLVFSLFILPAILMIGIYSLMGQMISGMMDDIEEHVPVMYVQNVPEGFDDYVKTTEFNAEIKYLEEGKDLSEIKNDIKEGNADLLVVFDTGFLDQITNYQEGSAIPQVKTFYNPSEDYSSEARTRFVDTVLSTYQQQLLSVRIGNLENIIVFHIDADNADSVIMDENKASGKELGMLLPYLITMLLFTGAMSLGVDAITGEKERGTMASMLITPLKRSEIVLGKLISLSILSCLSAVVYAGSMVVAMPMMLGNMTEGEIGNLGVSFSTLQILQLLTIMLVLVYLYVVIVVLISVFAKTAKEASTLVSPVMIVVIVAGMITMFQGNSTPALALFGIPVYGSAIAIQNLLVGELSSLQLFVNVGGTVAVAAILTALITKAFNSEKVMFNA